MNIQNVYEVKFFDRTPATPGFGRPRYVVLVYFTELALQMIKMRRQSADWNATTIARNLTRIERINNATGPGSGSQIAHPLVDLDTLGKPTAHPDGAGSRVWVTLAPEGSVFQTAAGSL
jgi:hypothetical protein